MFRIKIRPSYQEECKAEKQRCNNNTNNINNHDNNHNNKHNNDNHNNNNNNNDDDNVNNFLCGSTTVGWESSSDEDAPAEEDETSVVGRCVICKGNITSRERDNRVKYKPGCVQPYYTTVHTSCFKL